ncbi:MAG: hypothetical protein GY893_01160 [bacterium]|nr:hypothetical protein [bacterium]
MNTQQTVKAALLIAVLAQLSSSAFAQNTPQGRASSNTLPVLVSVEPSETSEAEIKDEPKEDDWRVYLDLYGFLPLSTTGDITINGNTMPVDSTLSDVLSTVTGLFTGRASVEYGRYGFMAGIIYGTSSETQRGDYRFDGELLSPSVDNLKLKGKAKTDFNQSVVDLAMRYRLGAIEEPVMKTGSSTFVGYAGARVIDAGMDMDISLSADVTVDGQTLTSSEIPRLEKRANGSISRTWVQPLVGMQATYAMSPEWQAFMRLDAGGFGLAGKQDLSGTAQAGIAYTVGNSAQLTLSWKYFGIEYQGYGSNNQYSNYQNGVNLGLRWVFL